MRNTFRSLMTLAALAALLGGMLGQGETVAAEPERVGVVLPVDSVAIASRPLPGEDPLPRWAYARAVAPRISVNPDPENPLGKVIEVDKGTQRLTAWQDGKIVYRFKISTARPGRRTPEGNFKVKIKARRWYSRQFQVWMPDALLFHGSYFIHSLPYRSDPDYRIGANRLGHADSAGCVRVGLPDSKVLWDWSYVGLPVWVHS